jgi:transposase, IS5 family
MSFNEPSPDHSTFSRFRKRLTKNTMDQINSTILRQFEQQGLNINEGVAIDARLVKSASRPVSNEKLEQLRKEHESPEGKLDKNGNPKKFSRDIESDWNAMKDNPLFGQKEHASVDVNNGFILATTMTPASVNDANYLPYCTVYSQHTHQKIEKVFADKGYAGKPNREFLSENKIADGIMRKDSTTAKLTEFETERNKNISKIRYIARAVASFFFFNNYPKDQRIISVIGISFNNFR